MKIHWSLIIVYAALALTACTPSIKNAITETVQISGNCGICETAIEKAGSRKNSALVDWDKETTKATLTYDAKKTTSDEILKRIALVGYDSEKFLAPPETYAQLADCCQYERTNRTVAKVEKTEVMEHNDMLMMDSTTTTAEIKLLDIQTDSIVKTSDEMVNIPSENKDEINVAPPKKPEDVADTKYAETTPTQKPTPKKPAEKVSEKPPVPPNKNQFTVLFDAYFAVKNELVKTNGEIASLKANDLVLAIAAVKMEGLKNEEMTVWMKVMRPLASDAKLIANTKDIVKQRNHFITLSTNIYLLMKEVKTETPVYYQFCPMANGGKGANWLSKENMVKNPYYGSQMLSCGKVVETIE